MWPKLSHAFVRVGIAAAIAVQIAKIRILLDFIFSPFYAIGFILLQTDIRHDRGTREDR